MEPHRPSEWSFKVSNQSFSAASGSWKSEQHHDPIVQQLTKSMRRRLWSQDISKPSFDMTARKVEEASTFDEEHSWVKECITENREATNLQTIPPRLQWWVVMLWIDGIQARKASLELNRNFAAKYGSVQWRTTMRSIAKHATDAS